MLRQVAYSDEQRERQRLADNYAGMTDGELQKLAQSAQSLTEPAWDALEDELDRRHLAVSYTHLDVYKRQAMLYSRQWRPVFQQG